MLTVENLGVSYGTRVVLSGANLKVRAGEVVGILGRNGSGKSTLLRTIAGLLPPRSGRITLEDIDITGWPTHRIARLGLAYLPQTRGIFPNMTVLENLKIASSFVHQPGISPHAEAPLVAPLLQDGKLLSRRAGLLSGGEQRILAISMALVRKPRLLLLDEPSAGLAGPIAVRVRDWLTAAVTELGAAVLLVEQSVVMARSVAHAVLRMERGILRPADDDVSSKTLETEGGRPRIEHLTS